MNIEAVRNDFPALREWTYLDSAFVGLFPRQVKEGYIDFIDRWMNFSVEGTKTILTEWLEKTSKVRNMVADLVGASPSEIAFTACTGSGLNVVINGMRWEKGDNVVFPVWEHNPLDTYTLRKHGVEPRPIDVRNGRVELSDLEKKVDDKTKLLQVSQVSYVNGFRFDLKDVSDIAHEHGAKVLVDSTQAVGAFETNFRRDDVDFVSAAPYKYLMGPAGLAFLYVRSENLAELVPDRTGWKNQIWKGDRAEEPTDLDTAEKFEYGTIHFQGVYALEKSLEYLERIGIETVERRNLELSSYLWGEVNNLGKKMYTPEDTKSPIVSFYQEDAVGLAAKLMGCKVKVTGREAHGGHVRISVHFYNTKEDVDNLIQRL